MNIEPNVEEEIKKHDEKIAFAEANFGDTEVRDAIFDKAVFYQSVGDYPNAIKIYDLALKKSVGVSKRLEVQFKLQQIYLNQKDLTNIKASIDKCKKFLEEGGDWEGRNKLKVYEGIYDIMVRNFAHAANLFLDAVTTFNSPEILSYNDLIFYTVLTSMVSLDRADIRKRVIPSSDILSVIREMPDLKYFLESFYKCDYKNFFVYFVKIIEKVSADEYLSPHKRYFIKEMRFVIYSQFLESYKTVTLQNMAAAFGVSSDFIDREISEFIASRRLTCKIDKVSGVIQSGKADKRNNLYQGALKQGDLLLNKLQKLSRVIES